MPNSSLDEITQILTDTLHVAAIEAHPHTQSTNKPRPGNMPQNSWYDTECRETRIALQKQVLLGTITYKKSRSTFQSLIRRKKRAFITQQELELYKLFQGKDSSEAWRFFHEQSPPLTITSPETWGKYATSLYTIYLGSQACLIPSNLALRVAPSLLPTW